MLVCTSQPGMSVQCELLALAAAPDYRAARAGRCCHDGSGCPVQESGVHTPTFRRYSSVCVWLETTGCDILEPHWHSHQDVDSSHAAIKRKTEVPFGFGSFQRGRLEQDFEMFWNLEWTSGLDACVGSAAEESVACAVEDTTCQACAVGRQQTVEQSLTLTATPEVARWWQVQSRPVQTRKPAAGSACQLIAFPHV